MNIQNSQVNITVNGVEKAFKYKTKAIDVLKEYYPENELKDVLAVKINNSVKKIDEELVLDATLEPIDYYDFEGEYIYMRTLKLVLYLAIKRLYKKLDIELCNTIDNCAYFMCHNVEFTADMADEIQAEMQRIVNANYTITREKVTFEEAYATFKFQGEQEKLDNMQIKINPRVPLCYIDGVATNMNGIVAPTTGYVKNFGIKQFRKGFVLIFPSRTDINKIDTNIKYNAVYKVYEEFNDYADQMNVRTVADLNQKIIDGEIGEVISLCEKIQENKFNDIISNITVTGKTKFVLVAGPSASGKTTFAKRLGAKIIEKGYEPITISMDNYFKERVDTPKLPNGEYDFETVDALDMELFNRDMIKLLTGKEIDMPEFNFLTGKKEYKGNIVRPKENYVYILEGIHALNPIVTEVIPDEMKYKIYIAPMTTLNLDEFSKVSTTDTRILRRMVRDSRTRGHAVDKTLSMWENIARGEKKYIYPYIKEADYIFNTSFLYEIAALSIYAKPLLLRVKTTDKNYSVSRRLYNFLTNFLTIDERNVPDNSILREFIG